MKRSVLNNMIDFNSPITDENLILSHDEIMSLVSNPLFKKQYDAHFYKYMDYLVSLTDNHNNGSYYKYMSIDINEQNNNLILTFSPIGLIMSLANMLNSLNYENGISFEALEERIEILKKIKTEKELEKNFPFLYNSVFLPNKKRALKDKSPFFVYEYETLQKDLIAFNLFKEKLKKQGIDADKEYKKAKNYLDYKTFIHLIAIHFKKVLSEFDNIQEWIRKNPIRIKLNTMDMKKIYLYIINQEIENMYLSAEANNKQSAQKIVMIIENLIKKYRSMFKDDTTQITFDRLYNIDKNYSDTQEIVSITTDINKIEKLFEDTVSKYPFLKRNVELPQVKKGMGYYNTKNYVYEYINSILSDTIKQDLSDGAEEIDNNVVDEKIKEIESEIESGTLTEKELSKKKLILKKIKMVLLDIKPIAKQTGVGVFSSYYTYFYPNGMVAIDKLNGYGALYIMPIHIYKEAKNKKNLTEVRMIPGVNFVTHRSESWLDDAKKHILNGCDNLTENDIQEAEFAASMEFPYTIEEMEKLQKTLENSGQYTKTIQEETENRKRRIKLLDDIDEELKTSSNVDKELTKIEIDTEIDKYNEEGLITFDELYDYWKKHHQDGKVKRNPVVAGITKTRAKDQDDNYCCELCGAKSFDHSDFDSHHMIPLNVGGVDNIYNTICLCPNCHRYAHSGKMTLSQKAQLFEIIRKHIEKDNPEYLSKLDKMLSPIAETEEYYEEHKEEIDENFSIEWNRQIRR